MYKKIKELAEERKVSFYRLSKATGISQGNFGNWKNGRSEPSAKALLKLSEYFGVPVSYFYGDKETTESEYDSCGMPDITDDDDSSLPMEFVSKLNELNDLGKERLMEQLDFLLSQDKYKKNSEPVQGSAGGIAV